MELITVKEYCERERITDAGARKRVSQKLIKSIKLDKIIYIVINKSTKDEKIESLKTKLKNSNDRVKLLRQKNLTVVNQDELIQELKERIKSLEEKLDKVQDKKDALYENVIAQMNMLLPHKP